jgi:hypothetical protein
MASKPRNQTHTKSIQCKKSRSWTAVDAMFVMRWTRQMPADDVLADWWGSAVDGLTGVDIWGYEIEDIDRNEEATELRCSIVFLAPLPRTVPDLARYLERHAADLCAWMGATDFAIIAAAAKNTVTDDFALVPPIISYDDRNRALSTIWDQLLHHVDWGKTEPRRSDLRLEDGINVPLHVRKVLEWVRAVTITDHGRHVARKRGKAGA